MADLERATDEDVEGSAAGRGAKAAESAGTAARGGAMQNGGDGSGGKGADLAREADRAGQVVRVSVVGVVANVLLAAFKAVVGVLSNSIAIVLDAVNNLSDAASSVITIVGTKLAGRSPDRRHPFGYGRVEYLTTIVIAALVLWAGVTSLVESVRRILSPEESSYTVAALVIVAVAVAVKLALGRYVSAQGRRLSSDSLVASGTDATMDAILSASTLVAALITVVAHVSIEAWVGAVISAFIIKAGVDILREAVGKLLGARLDPELAGRVKSAVREVPGVLGAYDLVLNDYGPDRLMGSVHVEVPDAMSAAQIDELERSISRHVLQACGVMIHTVGIYSTNTCDARAAELRDRVEAAARAHPEVREVHGFYLDREAGTVSVDVVLSYAVTSRPQRREVFGRIQEEIGRICADAGYRADVTLDADISD